MEGKYVKTLYLHPERASNIIVQTTAAAELISLGLNLHLMKTLGLA
jgi:hypothetical protein